jgi:uncharacterized protein YkwD
MKKKFNKTNRSKRYRRKNSHLRIFSFFVLAIFSLSVFFFPSFQHSNRALDTLPVPFRSQVLLPDPLQLETISTSVLGAQVIEPTDVVKYINIERAKVGSPALRISPKLMEAAQKRADVILKYQNFSHQDPYENIELTTVLPKVHYYYRWASENIGMGGVSAEDFVGGFMHSTSHRENLLNKYLSDTGVAVVTGPYNQYYVNIAVQLFAIPGSEEDVLGYTKDEVSAYKTQLTTIDTKLNPVYWTIHSFIDPKDYTQSTHQKLTRQKEILDTVYNQMKLNKPLDNSQIALILEYNKNL